MWLADLSAPVEKRLAALLDNEVDRWAAVDEALRDPVVYLRNLVLSGGKRLRPAFCHWAFVGAGGHSTSETWVNAAAALELLHAFALIHDDVMDGSVTRRGLDAVHTAFEARHTINEWRGDPRRFGEGVAILVGDVAFVYADMLLRGAPAAAWTVFDELRLEVNFGQYLDLLHAAGPRADRETARRISRYKSGLYTVERPLELGAALAGRLDELARPLSAYGRPLGEAYQLRDDLLGAFGNPELLGKPVGDDLREGKATLLVAIALEHADAAQREVLDRLGARDLGESEVGHLQEVFVETGAAAEVEALVESLTAEAVAALDGIPLAPDARTRLAELAWFVAGRDH